jgi:type VI secretion system protein ImpE
MTANELFQAGRLQESIDAAIADVKKHPTDTGRRGFFCELLCFAGELERADKQLDLLSTQLPEAAMQVALFRQLVRADQARHDFYKSGRIPEFIGEPTAAQSLALKASIEVREGNMSAAVELLEQAEEARIKVSGTCDDIRFDDFRDLDDLTATAVEVLTSTGKYYWIAPERIESIEFNPIESPRDLLWRPANMSVNGGPDGVVYIPVIYGAAGKPQDESLQLGRATDWSGNEGEPILGTGQRTFLVGEEDRPMLTLTSIIFGNADS